MEITTRTGSKSKSKPRRDERRPPSLHFTILDCFLMYISTYCFGRFGGFASFGRFVLVVLMVSLVLIVLFQSFRIDVSALDFRLYNVVRSKVP